MKKTAEEIYDDLRKRHKGVWSPKDTAVMAANIYASQFKPKWIPVGESLPVEDQRVLFLVANCPFVFSGQYTTVFNKAGFFANCVKREDVTDWMPAPERKEVGE